jgi:hypothetical protein
VAPVLPVAPVEPVAPLNQTDKTDPHAVFHKPRCFTITACRENAAAFAHAKSAALAAATSAAGEHAMIVTIVVLQRPTGRQWAGLSKGEHQRHRTEVK